MKIGSWFSLSAPGVKNPAAAVAPTGSGDSASVDAGKIGLGEGLFLHNGKVVSRDWLGRSQACEPGPAMQGLAKAYSQGRLSADEMRNHCRDGRAELLILGQPSPALTQALQSWPPEQRQKFEQLLAGVAADYRQTGPVQVVDRHDPTRMKEQPGPTFFLGSALEKLAVSGKLLNSRDLAGVSLLDNLCSLQQACAQDGYAGQDLFAWSLVHSAYSKRTFHQAHGKGTCGAATLGYVLWQENPSQLVGALRDWTYQGRAQTRSGPSERPPESIDPADSTPPADQILQASLMNLADPEYTYSLVQDRFSRPDGQTRERGLFPHNQEHLLNSLSDKDWASQPLDSQQLQGILHRHGGPVPVTLEWATGQGLHSLHLLAVQRVNDRHVYLRDPAGDRGVVLPESSQQLLGSGFQRLSRQEFDARLRQGLVPENSKARTGWLAALKQSAAQSRLGGLFLHTSET